jgi:hypothetical protein
MSTTSFTSPTHRPAFATLPHHHHHPQQLRRRRRWGAAAAAAERGSSKQQQAAASSSSSSSGERKQQQQQQQAAAAADPPRCRSSAASPSPCLPLPPAPTSSWQAPRSNPIAASCSCHHRCHLHRLKIATCSSDNKTDSLFLSSLIAKPPRTNYHELRQRRPQRFA